MRYFYDCEFIEDGSTIELARGELPEEHPFVTEGGQAIDHADAGTIDGDDPASQLGSGPFLVFGVTPEQDKVLDDIADTTASDPEDDTDR